MGLVFLKGMWLWLDLATSESSKLSRRSKALMWALKAGVSFGIVVWRTDILFKHGKIAGKSSEEIE